jgi:ABC-type multidrug transport system fused ATPase/permease subunit
MRLVREISSLFIASEKFKIALTALTRISLVGLDLIGIVLIGAVASLLAGTKISSESLFGKVLSWFDEKGIENSYALIFGAALTFFILKGLLSVGLISYTSRFMAKLETRVSERVFAGLLLGGFDFSKSTKREELVFSATHSVTAATTKAILVGSSLVSEASLLVIIALFLALTNVTLFLQLSIFFGVVAWLMHRFVTVASGRKAKLMHESLLTSQGTLLGALENRKQISLSRNQSSLIGLFVVSRAKFSRESADYQTLTTLPRYITEIAVILGGAILVVQRSVSNDGTITAPTIAIFLAAIFRIVASMVPIQAALGTWKSVEFESRAALDVLRHALPSRNETEPITKHSSHLEVISFQKASYSHSDNKRATLWQIDIDIAPGEFIGIVGASGSGKSTFADLLLGLISPDSGAVTIAGQPAGTFVRSNLGYAAYVPQSTYIFTGTLRQNVSLNFGISEPDEEERVREALRLAGLEDFSASLSEGLDTSIGGRGRALSGGESQRIGIARALYDEPRLLVLDEVTSALDAVSQGHISETIESLKGKVTLVLIAHKLETLRAADRIFKIDKGKLTGFQLNETRVPEDKHE